MSDGCKENGKHLEQQHKKPTGNEDFLRAIAKNAVAQICDNIGFQGFQNSALGAFGDVAGRYVMEFGKTCNLYANQGGRSQCNVFDVILGLDNLGSIQGFRGGSDFLQHSGMIREISQYMSLVDAIPFVFSLPRFPVSKSRKPPLSFLQMGVDPPDHIPPWLPAFPFSSNEEEERVDVGVQLKVQIPKKVHVELMNAKKQQQQQEQFTANNGSGAIEINPFLATPFDFGEKQVSVIEPPSRIWEVNHVHFMDTFAQVDEIVRNEVTEVEDTNTDTKLDGRPTLRFKLSNSRKLLRACKNVVTQMNGEDEMVLVSFERNYENEEKKRRAEQILKESLETPLDTT